MIRDAQYLLIEGGALHDLELDPLDPVTLVLASARIFV